MMRKLTLLIILSAIVASPILGFSAVLAQEESTIPQWIKTAFSFWVNDQISDQELLHAIQYFVENEMIMVPENNDSDHTAIIKNLQAYQLELSEKISKAQQLANNSVIRLQIIESNESFDDLNTIDYLIEQRDKEWVASDANEITPFMKQLMQGQAADILRTTIIDEKNSQGLVAIEEVIVTNSHGANVVISGKTTDYNQADEDWWREAKQHGTFVSEGHFDESAEVFGTDIAVKISDDEGNFIGVLKAVINVENVV